MITLSGKVHDSSLIEDKQWHQFNLMHGLHNQLQYE